MLNKIYIPLLSFLPISVILGNLFINLNIFLISLIMLISCLKNNDWEWTKNKYFKILIIFYFYIILNSTYNYLIDNTNNLDGLIRSVSFIKFIFLAFSLNVLILENKDLNRIFTFWLIILLIVIIDIFFELYFGFNSFGFKSLDSTRIVSFFYDENVVGAFIFAFGFVITSFFIFKSSNKKKKLFFNLLLLIIPLSIFITGERSNFLKSFILFFSIIFIIKSSNLIISKKKIILFLICGIFLLLYSKDTIFIKQTEFFKRILIVKDNKNFTDRFQNIKYFAHYDTAWEIFKDYPLNGVGNKNFRKKCSDEKYFNEKLIFSKVRCTTHPHQVHFELLSEHGIVGYLLFFYFFISFIKKTLINNFKSNNVYSNTVNLYLVIFLIPILPGGSIFSSSNGMLFWIIFALANREYKLSINN